MGHCITARTALQHVECLLGPSECPIQQVLHQSIRTLVEAGIPALCTGISIPFMVAVNARAHAAMRRRKPLVPHSMVCAVAALARYCSARRVVHQPIPAWLRQMGPLQEGDLRMLVDGILKMACTQLGYGSLQDCYHGHAGGGYGSAGLTLDPATWQFLQEGRCGAAEEVWPDMALQLLQGRALEAQRAVRL